MCVPQGLLSKKKYLQRYAGGELSRGYICGLRRRRPLNGWLSPWLDGSSGIVGWIVEDSIRGWKVVGG